jgi:hypothetical protein
MPCRAGALKKDHRGLKEFCGVRASSSSFGASPTESYRLGHLCPPSPGSPITFKGTSRGLKPKPLSSERLYGFIYPSRSIPCHQLRNSYPFQSERTVRLGSKIERQRIPSGGFTDSGIGSSCSSVLGSKNPTSRKYSPGGMSSGNRTRNSSL